MGSFINIRVYDTRFFWLGGLKLKVTPQATGPRCSLLATRTLTSASITLISTIVEQKRSVKALSAGRFCWDLHKILSCFTTSRRVGELGLT